MTVQEAIKRLERKRVIAVLGVSTSQISNKIKDGHFPAHWFDAMDKLAAGDGWEMPRDLFSWISAEDAAWLRSSQ